MFSVRLKCLVLSYCSTVVNYATQCKKFNNTTGPLVQCQCGTVALPDHAQSSGCQYILGAVSTSQRLSVHPSGCQYIPAVSVHPSGCQYIPAVSVHPSDCQYIPAAVSTSQRLTLHPSGCQYIRAAAQFSTACPTRSDIVTTNSGCWQKKRRTKRHVGNSTDADEIGRACGTCEGGEKCTERFGGVSVKERGYLGKQDIKVRITLKWILKK